MEKHILKYNGEEVDHLLAKIEQAPDAIASEAYVQTEVANLVNSAPETLDTLGEVAKAIQDNETVVDALNSAIGEKANKSDIPNTSNFVTKEYVDTKTNTAKKLIKNISATSGRTLVLNGLNISTDFVLKISARSNSMNSSINCAGDLYLNNTSFTSLGTANRNAYTITTCYFSRNCANNGWIIDIYTNETVTSLTATKRRFTNVNHWEMSDSFMTALTSVKIGFIDTNNDGDTVFQYAAIEVYA